MPTVRTVPTADLSDDERRAIRHLLDLAFEGDWSADDWDHTLGGSHLLVVRDGVPVAHGAVVQRRLLVGGRSVRCGYVEAVAVHPVWQRRGLASAVMTEAERLVDGGYELGALASSAAGRDLYLGRGWVVWQGPTAVLSPVGVVRTPDEDGNVLVRPVSGLDVTGELVCDWRDGDVW